MIQTVAHSNPVIFSASRSTKRTKLAATSILGEGNYPLDDETIQHAVEKMVGIFHPVQVTIRKGEQVVVHIGTLDEALEYNGLMQTAIFNVQKLLCQEFGIRVHSVNNDYLPEYG